MRRLFGGGVAALAMVGAALAHDDEPLAAGAHEFALTEDQTLLPWVDPAQTGAELDTALTVPMDGSYRFTLEVEGGGAQLRIDPGMPGMNDWFVGPGTTDWLELERGEHRLQVRFESTGGPKRLRVLWELAPTKQGGFPTEPIRTSAAFEPPGLSGRVDLALKGCTNCHALTDKETRAVTRRPAPNLVGVTERVSTEWLERWIADPSSIKPQADMPRVFAEADRESVRAVVHYLASLSPMSAETEDGAVATEEAVLARGRGLYHGLGCVACHGALDSPAAVFGDEFLAADVPVADVSSPFGDLRNKWRPRALARFLRDPAAVHVDGRMPSLNLSASESDLIAGYLLSKWGAATDELQYDENLAAWGREVFFKFDCGACHEVAGIGTTNHAPALSELRVPAPGAGPGTARGCLDPGGLGTPRYAELDVPALAKAILNVRGAHGAEAPLDEAQRTLARLACLSCHEHLGRGGVPEALRIYFTTNDEHVDLGDEGRLPPVLSDVGWRLQTSWLREILVGEGRSRPYMTARMPSYGEARVSDLPDQLARMAGVLPHSDVPEPVSTDELVLAGREMMGRTALGCVACHVYKDYPANGSPGLAITQFGERLRYEWYRSFMLNPQRYRPGSRMPDFGTGGVSTLEAVFDGDMQRQSEAMWSYFNLGELMPPPDGVESQGGNTILVGDRPVVLRAFLPGAGARGIAVGTKVGVHYAFSAEDVRLVDVWQGDFLDASGAWAGRGGSTLGGLGEVVWEAPAGPALMFSFNALDSIDDPWPDVGLQGGFHFRGYRLDPDGHPTFLYEVGPWHTRDGLEPAISVAERITVQASPRVRIVRTFTLPEMPFATAWFNGGAGKTSMRYRRGDGDWRPPDGVTWRADEARYEVAHSRRTGPLIVELETFP